MVKSRTARRELVLQLVETSRLLRTHVDQQARNRGTSRAQWSVLARLRRKDNLMQVDLAERLDMQPISLTRLIDRLEEQGFIERRADAKDRRANRLHLTQAGRDFVDALEPAAEDMAREVLSPFDDAFVAAMTSAVRAIKQRIKEMAAGEAGPANSGPKRPVHAA